MKDEGRPEGCACGRPSAPVTAFSPCCFHPSSFILHPSDSSFILHPSSFARRGVTLIELLVVAVIILMMLALAARQMKLSLDSRRAREAARAINVYLSSARNQAIATRRPCGVALMPMMNIVANDEFGDDGRPMRGDASAARSPRALLRRRQLGGAPVQSSGLGAYAAILSPSSGTPVSPGLVHIGDKIQFNNQGPWFYITSSGSDGVPPYSLISCRTESAAACAVGDNGIDVALLYSADAQFITWCFGRHNGEHAHWLGRRSAATPGRSGHRSERLVVRRLRKLFRYRRAGLSRRNDRQSVRSAAFAQRLFPAGLCRPLHHVQPLGRGRFALLRVLRHLGRDADVLRLRVDGYQSADLPARRAAGLRGILGQR